MPPKKESPLSEPSPEKIKVLNLLELTPEQEEELREEIARYDHSLILMVHPLFDEHHPLVRSFQNRIPRVKKGLRLIFKNIDRLPPLLIPEEHNYHKQTQKYLRDQLTEKSRGITVYTLPTFSTSPEPLIHNSANKYNQPDDSNYPYKNKLREQWQKNWESFRQILTRLGVQKVYIGGMQFLSIEYPGFNGCVGGYILNLEENTKIELLPFTNPEGIPEIKKSKTSIYQPHLRPVPSKRASHKPRPPLG